MNKQNKNQTIEKFKHNFQDSSIILVAHYRGLTVKQLETLRRRLAENRAQTGAKLVVGKNTLFRLALKGTAQDKILPLLKGPSILLSSKDFATATKILVKFSEENDKLVIVGGVMGTELLDKQQVIALSKLPSLDELRGRLIGLINAPATKVARVIKAGPTNVVNVLTAYSKKD